jgi:hypothetical protein
MIVFLAVIFSFTPFIGIQFGYPLIQKPATEKGGMDKSRLFFVIAQST